MQAGSEVSSSQSFVCIRSGESLTGPHISDFDFSRNVACLVNCILTSTHYTWRNINISEEEKTMKKKPPWILVYLTRKLNISFIGLIHLN